MSNQITQQDIETYFKVQRRAEEVANNLAKTLGYGYSATSVTINNKLVEFFPHHYDGVCFGPKGAFSLEFLTDEQKAKEDFDKREQEKKDSERKKEDEKKRLESTADVIAYKKLTERGLYPLSASLSLLGYKDINLTL